MLFSILLKWYTCKYCTCKIIEVHYLSHGKPWSLVFFWPRNIVENSVEMCIQILKHSVDRRQLKQTSRSNTCSSMQRKKHKPEWHTLNSLILVKIIRFCIGLDWYRVSADTGQYQWVLANTSSPVVRLPVSTVNTVAMHAYSLKPIPYFCAYTPHTYVTCTHLYPGQNCIFSTNNLYSPVSVSVSV